METREVDDDGRQARQTLRGPRTTALGVLGGRPPGLQRTPRSDLYAYRSMMTGGGSPSDSLFLYLAPNGRNPALIITPRNEKSRRPISFWEMTSNKLTMDNSTCHSGFWVGSCALTTQSLIDDCPWSSAGLSGIHRKAESSLGERMCPCGALPLFRLPTSSVHRKKPTFFLGFPVFLFMQTPSDGREPAGPPRRRRASEDPALVSQVAEVIGDWQVWKGFAPSTAGRHVRFPLGCCVPFGCR